MLDVREVATWLGQQFSGGMLASVYECMAVDILNLCVRHYLAVLDVGTTFSLPRLLVVESQIAVRPKAD